MTNDKQRERLVELLMNESCYTHECPDYPCQRCKNLNIYEEDARRIADLLLADGWMRPPCKVGNTVYVISRYYVGDWEVYKCEIDAITIYEKNTFISCVANDVRFGKINFGLNFSEIGKTLFLTKEEAEQALVTNKYVGSKTEEGASDAD